MLLILSSFLRAFRYRTGKEKEQEVKLKGLTENIQHKRLLKLSASEQDVHVLRSSKAPDF
jgi:hypothetical protein